MINLLYTLPTLLKNFEINILDHLFNEKHILKGTIINLSMRTINREQGLELKIILNEQTDVFMLRSRICRLHFETEKI